MAHSRGGFPREMQQAGSQLWPTPYNFPLNTQQKWEFPQESGSLQTASRTRVSFLS